MDNGFVNSKYLIDGIDQAPAKEFMIGPLDGLSTGFIGNWFYESVGSTDEVGFVFFVPNNFETFVSCDVIIIPDASETIQWDIGVSVAALGELYNNDDRAASNQQQAVTASQLTEVDISAQLTGLTANDYVGIKFQSDTITLRIIGLRFKYT